MLEACNVAHCHVVPGAAAEVTAAVVASKHSNCVAHCIDHADCVAASEDGLATEVVCKALAGAAWYPLEKVRKNCSKALLHVGMPEADAIAVRFPASEHARSRSSETRALPPRAPYR